MCIQGRFISNVSHTPLVCGPSNAEAMWDFQSCKLSQHGPANEESTSWDLMINYTALSTMRVAQRAKELGDFYIQKETPPKGRPNKTESWGLETLDRSSGPTRIQYESILGDLKIEQFRQGVRRELRSHDCGLHGMAATAMTAVTSLGIGRNLGRFSDRRGFEIFRVQRFSHQVEG